jgi:restriction system protein
MLFLILMFIVFMILYNFTRLVWHIICKIKIINLLEGIDTKEDLLYFRIKDFIDVIAEVFKRKGFKVISTDNCGEEGNGLILDDIKYAEVWKHGLNQVVDIEAAMKLTKCMRSNSIYRGMLVTLGNFKPNTRSYCHKNVIECIDGDQLLIMCKEVQYRKEVLAKS